MSKKPPFADFAQRLYRAQKRYELKAGADLDREYFGREVARLTRREKPLSDSTVSNWFTGKQMPVVPQLEAIALVLGVHPAWLAFGSADVLTLPDGDERPIDSEPPKSARRQQGQRGSKE